MAKAVQITEAIQAQINAAAGGDVDPNTITVFECTAINTKGLSKKGSIFDKAQISRSTLVEMAQGLNSQAYAVPLHTLHMQGEELPVGKVFYGEVFDEADGSSELRVLFYLPNDTQSHLISDINSAVIDEVSIGLRTKNALCSECGWNYYGPDATYSNLYDRTCANDHVIGEEGVHLSLVGLESWLELSLVSRGAAKNAKIVSQQKRRLAASESEKMAASGRSAEAEILILNSTLKEQDEMDLTVLVAQLGEKSAALALADKATVDANAALAAATAKVTDLETQVATLTASTGDQAAKLAELDVAKTFIADHAKKGLVATGKTDEPAADLAGQIAQIEAAQVALHALLPVGGKAVSADANAETTVKKSFGAFKTPA